jgi:hypothetical protein
MHRDLFVDVGFPTSKGGVVWPFKQAAPGATVDKIEVA